MEFNIKIEHEKPNNPRDVLVFVEKVGWMMGNYEGVWRLYFSDNGLKTFDSEYFELTYWRELPPNPNQ